MRLRIVLTWKRLAGLVALGMAGALFVGWSGLVSIAASSGHWPVTRWFLGWTLENAVATQSTPVEKPEGLDLSDPALIQRSAGNYATSCAACHGAPGVAQSPVVANMVPSPPRLEDSVGDWSDEELFWIVKNGFKYTGMPAWPAQGRDDEVWAQVAFLRALPDMTAATYADLALGGGVVDDDLEAGGQALAALDGIFENALENCARCHGRDGLGRGDRTAEGAFPIIAGQPAPYLNATLLAFAQGRRESGFMQPPASRYDAQTLAELAEYFARQPGPVPEHGPETAAGKGAEPALGASGPLVLPLDTPQDAAGILEGDTDLDYATVPMAAPGGPSATPEALLSLGRRIALDGIAEAGIPSCQSCHALGPKPRSPDFPALAGQPEWYLARQLVLWRDGKRGGTPFAPVMEAIAERMTEEQIDAVSAWYAGRPRSDR